MVDDLHNLVSEQPRAWVRGIIGIGTELDGNRLSHREIHPFAIGQGEVGQAVPFVRLGVIPDDEGARAPDEKQPHNVAPVVRIDALLERTQGKYRRVRIFQCEVGLADLAEHGLGPDTDVVLFVEKEPELGTEVEVSFVIRSGGQEDDLAVVPGEVFVDRLVDFAFLVPEVVGSVDDDEAITWQVGEIALGDALGHDVWRAEPELSRVVLPHSGEVLGAEDECFEHLVIRHHACDGGCDTGFPETHDISHKDTIAFVEMAASELDGFFLERQEEIPDLRRHPEFLDAFAGILREVPGHLQIDMKRGQKTVSGPAFLDDLDEFIRDVEAA